MRHAAKAAASALAAFVAQAVTGAESAEVKGKITRLYFHNAANGNVVATPSSPGAVFIEFALSPGQAWPVGGCGDVLKRVAASTDSPLYESVVSAAMMAKIHQYEVKATFSTACTVNGNSWDLIGFFFIE